MGSKWDDRCEHTQEGITCSIKVRYLWCAFLFSSDLHLPLSLYCPLSFSKYFMCPIRLWAPHGRNWASYSVLATKRLTLLSHMPGHDRTVNITGVSIWALGSICWLCSLWRGVITGGANFIPPVPVVCHVKCGRCRYPPHLVITKMKFIIEACKTVPVM